MGEKEIEPLNKRLRKAITPKCRFRIGSKEVKVEKITSCLVGNDNIVKGNFMEGNPGKDNFVKSSYQFTNVEARVAFPEEGNLLPDESCTLNGYFNIDDDDKVIIKGFISIVRRLNAIG